MKNKYIFRGADRTALFAIEGIIWMPKRMIFNSLILKVRVFKMTTLLLLIGSILSRLLFAAWLMSEDVFFRK